MCIIFNILFIPYFLFVSSSIIDPKFYLVVSNYLLYFYLFPIIVIKNPFAKWIPFSQKLDNN